MEYRNWTVDLAQLTAIHESGFSIKISGSPSNPTEIIPGRCPEGVSSLEQVRLLRYGVEAIEKAAKADRTDESSSATAQPKLDPDYKPKRPVLSLKKKKPQGA